jgi:alpha-tubulin suppressor-like RCC1 family protein
MAACGVDFTVALTEDGELLAWGEGRCGNLGLGAVLHQQKPARAVLPAAHKNGGGPEMFDNQRIRLASAGRFHLAVVAEDGAIYTCGYGVSNAVASWASATGSSGNG